MNRRTYRLVEFLVRVNAAIVAVATIVVVTCMH